MLASMNFRTVTSASSMPVRDANWSDLQAVTWAISFFAHPFEWKNWETRWIELDLTLLHGSPTEDTRRNYSISIFSLIHSRRRCFLKQIRSKLAETADSRVIHNSHETSNCHWIVLDQMTELVRRIFRLAASRIHSLSISSSCSNRHLHGQMNNRDRQEVRRMTSTTGSPHPSVAVPCAR